MEPPHNEAQRTAPRQIRIALRGRISTRLAIAFEEMTLVRRCGRTELVGEIRDQAQLHGLLARIRDLGLELEHVIVSSEGTPPPKEESDA